MVIRNNLTQAKELEYLSLRLQSSRRWERAPGLDGVRRLYRESNMSCVQSRVVLRVHTVKYHIIKSLVVLVREQNVVANRSPH
jgi:hypothetical protein